jgi:hypothetical protein
VAPRKSGKAKGVEPILGIVDTRVTGGAGGCHGVGGRKRADGVPLVSHGSVMGSSIEAERVV